MLSAVAHRPKLNLGAARRHTDDHSERLGEEMMVHVDHTDKTSHHLLTCVEVGDDTVFERPAGDDVLMRFLMHHLCLTSNSNHLLGVAVHRHHRRLIDNDFAVHDDDGVGSAEVHRYILC